MATSLRAFGRGEPTPPDYNTQVAPILKKYCVGCHNPDDHEGKLSLETFADIERGGEHGRVVLPGQSDASRLARVLTGKAEPVMPPKDESQPKPEDIALLVAWIDAGARGPDGTEPDRTTLLVPQIKPAGSLPRAVTAVAVAPKGDYALARFGKIELVAQGGDPFPNEIVGLPGKVNALSYSGDGQWLIAASGVTGLYGQARIYSTNDRTLLAEFTGHRDILYAAVVDPEKKVLATAGYDQKIILWDFTTGKPLRTLDGHNGAIFDLAFSPDGSVLASASGDETVKLWSVATGQRLDTLGQPLAEQYAVAFSPDGRYIVAGGADNRVRVWRFVSKKKQQINPLRYARFGHEGAIVRLAFSADGSMLATASEDRAIKLWETQTYTQVHAYPEQPDTAAALAFDPSGKSLLVARMDGSHEFLEVPAAASTSGNRTAPPVTPIAIAEDAPMQQTDESEPNDTIDTANAISLPATVRGAIDGSQRASDSDLFRFDAKAGQQWMVEINAARSKSPLDSRIEVLDHEGRPVPRVMLRAVRDSYFTFRGKDSDTIDDFRVHNWEEMELNQLLYANGEVVKLFQYPRGPDSGFKVYPNTGKRYCYFDTTATSHALGEPCYIVEPVPPGSELIPNGLPVFQVDYENDDDALRQWGADSRMTFTAPADGTYVIRVTDTRGFHGPGYKYTLTVRPRRPDFNVTIHGAGLKVAAGSGKKFHVTADRIDGFDGEIHVDITGLPPGFHVTTPLVIEAGHLTAYGAIHARPDAPQPTPNNAGATKILATAQIDGKDVVKQVSSLGEIKLEPRPQLLATLSPPDQPWSLGASDSGQPIELPELTIVPGQTITATLRIERNGHKGLASFGGAEAGWNLPHGVFVDNIGLNGVLIPDGAIERTIFISAAKWVPETTRTFFLESKEAGNQCTWPVILHVKK